MQTCIMLLGIIVDFINRIKEMERLDQLASQEGGGLAVLYGRRRIGKTRLLLEWSRRHGGLYTVADPSTAEIQRRYFAESVAEHLPGFAEVATRDWRSLLRQLAKEAQIAGWRGPIIFDELPYLVMASPELPSVLQRWVDHDARQAGLVVAVAGSSQRMMRSLVLSRDAPLFGRARELLKLGPIDSSYLYPMFRPETGIELVEHYTAWGGVPRYWELAVELDGDVPSRLERLALDPLGPLHREPDRLLLEEIPSALETRPVLDAIGSGAHRVSEIAGRLGRKATSMSRPLDRLVEMGLVRREVPFGELEKKSRRGVYKIRDPFFRFWFRVVAPNRGQLASSPLRRQILERHWRHLNAEAWEELCRQRLPGMTGPSILGQLGPWGPASRWWHGASPEWDVVSESVDGRYLLLGEVHFSSTPFSPDRLQQLAQDLATREPPKLSGKRSSAIVRALFVPEVEEDVYMRDVQIVGIEELIPRPSSFLLSRQA
ncbi:MAG: ATP-binding protein [Acidobacteriota bacterium]